MYPGLNYKFSQKEKADMQTKETNPKDAVGVRKVPTHVVPQRVVAEMGLALLEGARKYGSYNWRAAGVRASVYYDAVVSRHLAAWWEGEDIDADSNLSHITKAIAGLTVLRDSMMHGNWQDDRPIRAAAGWVQDMNVKAGAIIDKYPDAKAPYLEVDVFCPDDKPVERVPVREKPKVRVKVKPELDMAEYRAKVEGSYTVPANPVYPGQIFLDMDGVLADFDAKARKLLGTDNTYQWEFQHGAKAFWEKLDADPNFFGSLPTMPGMWTLWNAVKHRNPIVLTALPKVGATEVDRQKREWIADTLGLHVKVITCQTFEKPLYCSPGDVLVDDRTVNRDKWEAAGGILLYHRNADKTVKRLRALGYL